MASDAFFNCTHGAVKPLKHTLLGFTVGSLTGSKTLLLVLKKMGHCIGYNSVKSLESSFDKMNKKSGYHVPDGILIQPDLCLAFAWDNYDANLDTLDGKSSLHITVGIAYQNCRACDHSSNPSSCTPVEKSSTDETVTIPAYYKKLKDVQFTIEPTDESDVRELIMSTAPIDFYYSCEFFMINHCLYTKVSMRNFILTLCLNIK